MRIALVLQFLLATTVAAQEHPYPQPYCTDGEGDRVELGGLTCITAGCVPAYLARCEMSQNNAIWRKLQEGCPAVALQLQRRDPETRGGPAS